MFCEQDVEMVEERRNKKVFDGLHLTFNREAGSLLPLAIKLVFCLTNLNKFLQLFLKYYLVPYFLFLTKNFQFLIQMRINVPNFFLICSKQSISVRRKFFFFFFNSIKSKGAILRKFSIN